MGAQMAKKTQGQAEGAAPAGAREELARRIGDLHLPRYAELPDFDIYMDQLLLFVERALAPVTSPDDRPLTASMVNNYVKARVLPAVRGKRYGREHVATLLAVCLAKRAFSMARVAQMARLIAAGEGGEASYDAFCELFEGHMRALAGLAGGCGAREAAARATPKADLLEALAGALANVIYLDDLLALGAGGEASGHARA